MAQEKERAQFWVALTSVGGLALVTLASLARDALQGKTADTTLMLTGGLVAVCSAACGWLFRNGNGPSRPDKGS